MNMNLVRLSVILGTAASFAVFQESIPIRQLSPAEATSTTTVAPRGKVFEMSDGRVLLNDQGPMTPRLVLFDANLGTSKIVGDSTTLTTGPLRNYGFSMIPFRADSTVIADPNGNTLMILDPNGKNANVMTMPKPREAMIVSNVSGNLGFDSHMRLIYRASYPTPPRAPVPGELFAMSAQPDTFPIVRADFEARTVDTLASIHLASELKSSMTQSASNRVVMTLIRQPLPTTDEWAVLADGTVGIVRGHDYHVDWIREDGTHASTPKLTFDWRRVTDEEKQHMIDSLTAQDAKTKARSDSLNAARGLPAASASINYTTVPIKELPDYYPPIRTGSVVADRDGDLWILPTTSSQARGGLLYDVVNQRQGLFERVQLPSGCGLAGFGSKSRVYLTCTEKVPGDTVSVTHLKRMRIDR